MESVYPELPGESPAPTTPGYEEARGMTPLEPTAAGMPIDPDDPIYPEIVVAVGPAPWQPTVGVQGAGEPTPWQPTAGGQTAAEIPADHRILNGHLYASVDEVMADLNGFGKDNGLSFIKKSASNYRFNQATFYLVQCNKSTKLRSRARGIRHRDSKKTNCPWLGSASANASNGWKWTFKLKDPRHNHPPFRDMKSHQAHRRMSPEARARVLQLCDLDLSTRQIYTLLRHEHPDTLTEMRDIINFRDKLRRKRRNGSPCSTGSTASTSTSRDGATGRRFRLRARLMAPDAGLGTASGRCNDLPKAASPPNVIGW